MKTRNILFIFDIAFLVFLVFVFVTQANAQGMADSFKDVGSAVTTTITTGIPKNVTREKRCKIYADTPMADVERAKWELEFRLGFLDFDSGGMYNFNYQNLDVKLVHNLSNVMFAYAWAGRRYVTKPDYEGSAYDTYWEVDMIFGGFGLYVMSPLFKVFAGGGTMFIKNDAGEPDISTPIERGVGYDYHFDGGGKLVFEYRIIDAPLKDKPNVSELTGNQSFSALSMSYSTPF